MGIGGEVGWVDGVSEGLVGGLGFGVGGEWFGFLFLGRGGSLG